MSVENGQRFVVSRSFWAEGMISFPSSFAIPLIRIGTALEACLHRQKQSNVAKKNHAKDRKREVIKVTHSNGDTKVEEKRESLNDSCRHAKNFYEALS